MNMITKVLLIVCLFNSIATAQNAQQAWADARANLTKRLKELNDLNEEMKTKLSIMTKADKDTFATVHRLNNLTDDTFPIVRYGTDNTAYYVGVTENDPKVYLSPYDSITTECKLNEIVTSNYAPIKSMRVSQLASLKTSWSRADCMAILYENILKNYR